MFVKIVFGRTNIFRLKSATNTNLEQPRKTWKKRISTKFVQQATNISCKKGVKIGKKVRVKLVTSAIMNQLSYHVSQKKLNKAGLILKSDIEKDIKETIKLLKNI